MHTAPFIIPRVERKCMRMNDTKGSMPFAVVAVALLVASAALAGAVAQHRTADDGVESAVDDIGSVQDAVDDVTVHVNRGLGEIIRSVSTASDGTSPDDTLAERVEEFDRRTARWMESQFPIRSGGAVAHLVSYDVLLTAETLPMAVSGEGGGYTPAYLRGTGTVQVRVEAQSGSGETSLAVRTDGSYALPLAAERGSLFESMAGRDSVTVSEMVAYQLTCLAQHRVMNGYGGSSEYGPTGTSSVITGDDVREAYRTALDAVSMICFRDPEGRFAGEGQVDLADALVAGDGVLELDLSAVYAQALTAVIDDIALRWFDYFCGFQVLDALDRVLNPLRNAVKSLVAFIFGEEEVYSAVPYIRDTMDLAGIPESEYRFPGSGTTTVTYDGTTVTVDNPTYDVLEAPWLEDFGKRYEEDRNFVMDFIHDVLRMAAANIYESGSLGKVSVRVDAHDGTSFADSLTELFDRAVADGESVVAGAVTDALDGSSVRDPFYGAIADEISAHGEDMVLSSELERRISAAFGEEPPKGLAGSEEMEGALEAYRDLVRSDLEVFDRLRDVESEAGVIKETLARICAFGLEAVGITDPVPEKASQMCREIALNMGMNPYGGVTDLPGSGSFLLDDGAGGITEETISAEIRSDPDVSVSIVDARRSPDDPRCVHTVGFDENPHAAYSTVFRVSIEDAMDLTLTGSGSLSQAMGGSSSLMEQEVEADTWIEVTVSSGWPLAGVEYVPSVTIVDDVVELLMKVLEPLLEPLRKVVEIIRTAVSAVSEAMIEALAFVAEQVARIYEAVIGPLTDLKEWLEGALESLIADAAFDVLVDIAMNDQSLTLKLFGCELELTTRAMTWAANTKTLVTATLTMPVAGLTLTAFVTAKVRGEMAAENLIITGGGGLEKEGEWSVEVNLDPLMRGSRYLITLDGEIGDTDISIVAPKLESYHDMGIALSDVPGLGQALSNIPVMGAKVGLDAGFSLKYSEPIDTGLIVNEFESNPAGTDRGNEWVELLNNSASAIDLTGYTLLAASDRRTKCMELSGTIAPGELLVIHPDFTLVNSSGKSTTKGEALIIKDADGNEIERTPTKKDTANDGMSWQRTFDGSAEWTFAEATVGRTNDTHPGSQWVSAEEMKGTVWRAVERSFDRVESITDLETLEEFLKHMVRYTLEGLIGTVAGRIVEASVFVSLDVSDISSTASAGVRLALRTDGDLVEDVLRYALGKVMELVLNADNPYRIQPLEMFAENIDLEVTVHAGVGFPEILSGGADLPAMDLGVTFRTNVSALTRVLGADTGRPEIVFGVRIIDCPKAAIPSKLSAKDNMEHDLWLMLLTARFG